MLTTLYYNVASQSFPIEPFFKPWKHPRGQVSFLLHSIYSPVPHEYFNFSKSSLRLPQEIAVQPDKRLIVEALTSLDLLKILIELSVTEFYTMIRNLFLCEMETYPGILI